MQIFSLSIGGNIELMPGAILIPDLCWDHHDIVGNNRSLSLNLPHALTERTTLKAGIACVYKAPNLC